MKDREKEVTELKKEDVEVTANFVQVKREHANQIAKFNREVKNEKKNLGKQVKKELSENLKAKSLANY